MGVVWAGVCEGVAPDVVELPLDRDFKFGDECVEIIVGFFNISLLLLSPTLLETVSLLVGVM